jgi:hypothetical protein
MLKVWYENIPIKTSSYAALRFSTTSYTPKEEIIAVRQENGGQREIPAHRDSWLHKKMPQPEQFPFEG